MQGVIFCYIFQTVFIVYRWSPYYAGGCGDAWRDCTAPPLSLQAALTAVIPTRMYCTENRIYVFPGKGIARPQSKLLHSCVCERFINSQDRSTYLAAAKYVDQSWEYINLSQIYKWWNWETELYNSVLEIMRLHSFILGNTLMETRHLYSSFLVFIGMVFPDVLYSVRLISYALFKKRFLYKERSRSMPLPSSLHYNLCCESVTFWYGSCYFRSWPSRHQQKTSFSAFYFLKVYLHRF